MKHGMYRTKIYWRWHGMKNRCNNPKQSGYKDYGGRGIRVCIEWNDFINFYNDMFATYQEGLILDRINNDGDYCKENCRWTSYSTSQQNKRNMRKNKTSHYTGVSWRKRENGWLAKIQKKYIGIYKTELEAAAAYNKEAIKIYGQFAKLNTI